MKSKILAALTIYIYTVIVPTAWALHDATSFNPETVQVQAVPLTPVGTVAIWTKEEIPDGWLECNGQAVNADLYPDLAELMSNTPNYQGMFLRGAGSQTINHGKYGSVSHETQLGQVQGDAIRNIEGSFTEQPPYSWPGSTDHSGVFKYRPSNVVHPVKDGMGGARRGYYDFNASLVVPTSEENRPVNVGVKYIIKAE